MATITTNAYSGRSISLDVWETGNFNSNNSTREYGWKLRGSGGDSTWYTSGNFKAVVAGNQVYYSANRINLYNGTVVAQGSVWIQHNGDGSKYVDMYCEAGIYYGAVNCRSSGGFWGQTVPRYANLYNYWKESTDLTSVVMRFQTDNDIDHVQYAIEGFGWANLQEGFLPTRVGSVWIFRVSGLSPNNIYNIRIRIKRRDSQLWTESGFANVLTHGIATISNIPTFNDTTNPTISFSNPSGWTMNLYLEFNGINIKRLKIPQTSPYTISLTSEERKILLSNSSTSNSLNVVFKLCTVDGNGSELFNHTVNSSMSIINANPIITSFFYEDINPKTLALTNTNRVIVLGVSNLKVSNIVSNTVKEATHKSILINGVSYPYSNIYEKILNSYSDDSISLSIIDSRNNVSTSKSFDLTLINYFPIEKQSGSVSRNENGVGEGVTLYVSGNWFNNTFGKVVNTLTASYKFKKKTDSTWVNGTTVLNITNTNNKYVINTPILGDINSGFDINSSYDIRVTISDKLSQETYDILLTSGSPAIAIYKNKISLGGKYDETFKDREVQVQKDLWVKNALVMGNEYLGKGVNLNDYKKPGQYGIYGICYNSPVSKISVMVVYTYSKDWLIQIVHELPDDIGVIARSYRRYYHLGNTWTNWELVLNSASDIYPVGSIIFRTDVKNPTGLYGGTWVRLVGRYIYAMTGNTLNVSPSSGNNVTDTTLSIDQIPGHRHSNVGIVTPSSFPGSTPATSAAGGTYGFHYGTENSVGGGKPHNHEIPYIGVAVWYRTA